MKTYIYQQDDWAKFYWDNDELVNLLGQVRMLQGKIIGQMKAIGFELQNLAILETMTLDVVKSSEIEGELLNQEQVRSSIARKLGLELFGLVSSDRNVEGVVEMMWDAIKDFDKSLTKKRLCNWHYSLFPTGRSGMYNIKVGNWRNDSNGPMQVVSGAMGKEKVHYQAPPAQILDLEMKKFIKWFNTEQLFDPVLKAGIAHLWFISVHPFEDGNGRIARALTDMLLARADGISQRFYSMSSQIRVERNQYYNILENTQKGTLDITQWLVWFLNCLLNALNASEQITKRVFDKHHFWTKNQGIQLNERQKIMLNKLFDGFEGKLTSSKWAKITKCSTDTALRDINDLIAKKLLKKDDKGGRSTGYKMITNV